LEASERKEEERNQWKDKTKDLNADDLVFLDESGSNIALTRLYARAPRGKRAKGSIPRNRGKKCDGHCFALDFWNRGMSDFRWVS
jgi:hypothetical protein